MAPQNQGTVALLTAGKVHILAPVARGFGRNPPCYPGDQKSQSTKVSLRTLTVSVWMKIGDWSVKTEILEETALNLSWVSSLSMCRPFDSFPIYIYCWVLPKHCKQWSLWRLGFPSLKKNMFVDPLCEPGFVGFPTSIKGPGHVIQRCARPALTLYNTWGT